MPTTFEAIRDAQATAIESLSPSQHAGKRFLRHREGDFMDWVAENSKGGASFRRFQILREFDIEQGATADGSIESCRHTEEIRIAYPLEMGRYGAANERDLEDMMSADLHQIDAVIGLHGGATYVTNQDICLKQASSVLDVEGARVLSITYIIQYDRSV